MDNYYNRLNDTGNRITYKNERFVMIPRSVINEHATRHSSKSNLRLSSKYPSNSVYSSTSAVNLAKPHSGFSNSYIDSLSSNVPFRSSAFSSGLYNNSYEMVMGQTPLQNRINSQTVHTKRTKLAPIYHDPNYYNSHDYSYEQEKPKQYKINSAAKPYSATNIHQYSDVLADRKFVLQRLETEMTKKRENDDLFLYDDLVSGLGRTNNLPKAYESEVEKDYFTDINEIRNKLPYLPNAPLPSIQKPNTSTDNKTRAIEPVHRLNFEEFQTFDYEKLNDSFSNNYEKPENSATPIKFYNNSSDNFKSENNTTNVIDQATQYDPPSSGDSTVMVKPKIPPLKFPGYCRKLFWSAGTLIRFLVKIRKQAIAKSIAKKDEPYEFIIFRIRLLEIMTALHRVYLEPEGEIYSAVMEVVRYKLDLSVAFNPNHSQYETCVDVICKNLQVIFDEITEFMPTDGILGTSKNSALIDLIKEGNKFPDNYFWECEKELLEYNEKGQVINVNKWRAILIFIGAVVVRGLITTLLCKPIKFRLMRGELSISEKINIKILATLLVYVTRKSFHKHIKMDFPLEWQDSLYNDEKMDFVYGNEKIRTTVSNCRKILYEWSDNYVTKLDLAVDTKRP